VRGLPSPRGIQQEVGPVVKIMKNKKYFCCGIKVAEGERCPVCSETMESEFQNATEKSQHPEIKVIASADSLFKKAGPQ